ncbi:hypothetical protein E1301_Tti003848 [Triplophysa tibetana]|uniref:Uncharacterized protein n=1 Tax=Triplophysa tibetana TaxID=1572043 RepID=A0A5A9PQW5_9TELE|nr:hypothetical protein E1301_Tti003848 [Triplophysa tibetana]
MRRGTDLRPYLADLAAVDGQVDRQEVAVHEARTRCTYSRLDNHARTCVRQTSSILFQTSTPPCNIIYFAFKVITINQSLVRWQYYRTIDFCASKQTQSRSTCVRSFDRNVYGIDRRTEWIYRSEILLIEDRECETAVGSCRCSCLQDRRFLLGYPKLRAEEHFLCSVPNFRRIADGFSLRFFFGRERNGALRVFACYLNRVKPGEKEATMRLSRREKASGGLDLGLLLSFSRSRNFPNSPYTAGGVGCALQGKNELHNKSHAFFPKADIHIQTPKFP